MRTECEREFRCDEIGVLFYLERLIIEVDTHTRTFLFFVDDDMIEWNVTGK